MDTKTLYFIIGSILQLIAIGMANYIVYINCKFTMKDYAILTVLYIFAYSILYFNFCN